MKERITLYIAFSLLWCLGSFAAFFVMGYKFRSDNLGLIVSIGIVAVVVWLFIIYLRKILKQ